jgi:hypothetical protein
VLLAVTVAVAGLILVGVAVSVGVLDGEGVIVTVGVQNKPPTSVQLHRAGVEVSVDVGVAVEEGVAVGVGVSNEMRSPRNTARMTSVWVGVGKGWSVASSWQPEASHSKLVKPKMYSQNQRFNLRAGNVDGERSFRISGNSLPARSLIITLQTQTFRP